MKQGLNLRDKHIIFGDIHGCIEEFEQLLKKIDLKKSDKLYFIGDLIDKGPDSIAVVKKVFQLSLIHSVVLILGNHEEKFLRFIKNSESNINALSEMQNTKEFDDLLAHLSINEIEMLQSAFLYYSIPFTNVILIHGGIPEKITITKGNSLLWKDTPKEQLKKMRLLTMTRMLNEKGDFLGLNEVTSNMYFWADKYDGRCGEVIFGHQPFIGKIVKQFSYAIGIDTGCVFGGALSAIIIDEKEEKEIIYQEAFKSYCL